MNPRGNRAARLKRRAQRNAGEMLLKKFKKTRQKFILQELNRSLRGKEHPAYRELKNMRMLVRQTTESGLNAAELDPLKPKDKEIRGEIHRIMQKPINQAAQGQKPPNQGLQQAMQVLEKAKGKQAAEDFKQAYQKASETGLAALMGEFAEDMMIDLRHASEKIQNKRRPGER